MSKIPVKIHKQFCEDVAKGLLLLGAKKDTIGDSNFDQYKLPTKAGDLVIKIDLERCSTHCVFARFKDFKLASREFPEHCKTNAKYNFLSFVNPNNITKSIDDALNHFILLLNP